MADYFFSNTTIVKKGLNGKMEEEAWQQCTLPASKGGLGIRLPTDLDLPAFLSSAFGAAQGAATLLPEKLLEAEYQPLVEAENLWKEEIPDETLQPSDKTVQAHWDAPLFTKKFDNLLEGMIQPADKARLRAVASDHASDWLNAIPVASLGLKLDNTSLRIACTVTQAKSLHDFRLLYNNVNIELRSCSDRKIRVTRAKSGITRGSNYVLRHS